MNYRFIVLLLTNTLGLSSKEIKYFTSDGVYILEPTTSGTEFKVGIFNVKFEIDNVPIELRSERDIARVSWNYTQDIKINIDFHTTEEIITRIDSSFNRFTLKMRINAPGVAVPSGRVENPHIYSVVCDNMFAWTCSVSHYELGKLMLGITYKKGQEEITPLSHSDTISTPRSIFQCTMLGKRNEISLIGSYSDNRNETPGYVPM